jgi:Ca2+-binding EF-hand superfamily protein
MTDSLSLKSKPSAAILMALALITTTFAGVSFADHTDETGLMNTFLSMDYDELEITVDFGANGTDYGTMTGNYSLREAENEGTLLSGSYDLMEETDNTSWNSHWGSFNLALFFEQTAEDGSWYTVEGYVYAENSTQIGYNWIDICMDNGSVCESDMGGNNSVPSAEEIFDEVDADGDGAINGTELINHENSKRSEHNESAMDADEETELLDAMADYDKGYTSADGNDTEDANDGMLEFNEFMDYFYDYIIADDGPFDAMLDADGVLSVMIHNDDGDVAYVEIIVWDMLQNEIINETHDSIDSNDPTSGFDNWTSPDCCASPGMFYVWVHFYDENGDLTAVEMLMVGEMPSQEEMTFQMFDLDANGKVSVDEYFQVMEQADNQTIDNQTKNMFTNLFMTEDYDGDQELNMEEFSSFLGVMFEMGDGGGVDDNEYEMMMAMIDADGDGNLSLSELLVMFSDEMMDDEASTLTMTTNLFNFHDEDNNNMLDMDEMVELFKHLDRLDSEVCYEIAAGDVVFQEGEFWKYESDGDVIILKNGDSAPNDGEFCFTKGMDSEMLRFMADTNGDGSLSLSEILARFNFDNNMTDVELEYLGIAFKMSDSDANELLNENELRTLMDIINNYKDDVNAGEEELFEGCVDAVNRVPMDLNKTDCMAANYQWMGERGDQDGENNDTRPDDEDTMIKSNQVDVWFEQWNDQTMELVIVELITVDSQDEIARLVNMADAEYGNNDSMLDQAEINMLMNLYALTLNPDEMTNGLALDGTNGTAVDFWIEIDGLLEGDDVVFLRIGTVIAFPTDAYDNSTSHTFTVAPEMDDSDNIENVDNDCDDTSVWIHNSNTWNVKTATGFTFDERNNAWYSIDKDCQNHDVITFELEKAENATLPNAEEEDWTWEDEEMNMFPICDWTYSVTFANNSSLYEQGVDEAPESGDYEIVLDDDAAYEITLFCWDPEGGKMTVDIGSVLGNSTNSSIGETMGAISFKLPAGAGGNYTFDFSWTDEYHTESGTLTVIATGDGTIDLSDIEVDGEGILPGFTVGLGVLAMLGAAMFAGRRNEA